MRPLLIFILSNGLLLNVALAAGDKTTLELNFAHFDRDFENQNSNRKQTGIGLILQHKRPLVTDTLTVNLAAYSAQKWFATGRAKEDVFALKSGRIDGFALLGEASFALKLGTKLDIEIGRTQHKSLLLKSQTRVLPSTFQGINLSWALNNKAKLYAHRFTQWSRRADDGFGKFETNNSSEGAISAIGIAGGIIEQTVFGDASFMMQAEYLEADDYLRKWGITGSFSDVLNESYKLRIKAGLFGSHDAGTLFIDGADDVLDVSSNNNDGRLKHNGLGAYVSGFIGTKKHRFGVTYTWFGEPWLEDNFDGDHGTTPFPTKTYGPELTNKNERVWMVEYRCKWHQGRFGGLSAEVAYANGHGIENSISQNLGQANESWAGLDIGYQPPGFKYANFRVRYRDYSSKVNGVVAGVASDRQELRITANLKYVF